MHAGQSKAIAMDGFDVNFLGETGRKIVAIESDARQRDPVGFDFDGGTAELDSGVFCCGAGLAGPVPKVCPRDIIGCPPFNRTSSQITRFGWPAGGVAALLQF